MIERRPLQIDIDSRNIFRSIVSRQLSLDFLIEQKPALKDYFLNEQENLEVQRDIFLYSFAQNILNEKITSFDGLAKCVIESFDENGGISNELSNRFLSITGILKDIDKDN